MSFSKRCLNQAIIVKVILRRNLQPNKKIYKDSEGNIIEQHWFDKHLGKIIMNNLVK